MIIWLILGAMVLLGFVARLALNPLRTAANMIQVITFCVFIFACVLGANVRWGTLGGETDPIDVAFWSGGIWVGVMVLRLLPHFFVGMQEEQPTWEYYEEPDTAQQGYDDAYQAGFDAYQAGMADARAQYEEEQQLRMEQEQAFSQPQQYPWHPQW